MKNLTYTPTLIKSFKHNGHLHRQWLENWLVPQEFLDPEHQREGMVVLINCQTPIMEADGKQWMSKVPAVSFFIPGAWYNIVALIEETGVRYYCNIASPPYLARDVVTYIDYDLDVVLYASGHIDIVDRDEYERHKASYHYPEIVDQKVATGLSQLLDRIQNKKAPFQDGLVVSYYNAWRQHFVKE